MSRLLLLLLLGLPLAGCTLTRDVEIRQGSEAFSPEQLQLIKGLSSIEVREQFGPPQSRWKLGNEVWIYYYRQSARNQESWQTVEVHFNRQLIAVDIVVAESQAPPDG